MTIPSTARKAGPLLGNGVQDEWPFAFKVFAEGDIKVTIADSDGVETVLVLDTDYSVALNGNQDTSPGGTVTYPISGAELPTGSVLTITGAVDYDQVLDLPGGGNFSPLAVENQLDRTTMQVQQLREELDRAARLPVTSAEDAESLVADIVRIADSADNLDAVAANIGDVNTVATNIADVNGLAAVATQIQAAGDNIAAVVAVGNDLLEPVSEINTVAVAIADVGTVAGSIADVGTVAGIAADVSTVAGIAADVTTVADNLADVTNFAGVYQGAHAADPVLRNNGGALQSGDLYFNTTENALRAYSGTVWVAGNAGSVSVQSFSGDDLETEFTLTTAPTSENNTQVYIGGTYQQKSQYSIAGTTLTFTEAPPAGTDNIEVVTLSALALGETDAALVANTPAGNISATNVQAAINELDAEKASLAGVQTQAATRFTVGGTADAMTGTLSPVPTLTAGLRVTTTPPGANTVTGPTIALNDGAAKTIKKRGSGGVKVALVAGDYNASGPFNFEYDGTDFVLLDPIVSTSLAQKVTSKVSTVATGTTVIPADNTIPQITEGDQYLTLAITPTNSSSELEIDITISLSNSAANSFLIAALFQDATANALAAAEHYMTTAGGVATISFKHIMSAGTTSATTFTVRAGGSNAGTTTLNGSATVQHFGGVMSSRITIKEYLP